eukprot:EG_transcript_21890
MSDGEGDGEALAVAADAADAPRDTDPAIREPVDLQPLQRGLQFHLLKVPEALVRLVQEGGAQLRLVQYTEGPGGLVVGEELTVQLPDPGTGVAVECPVAFTDPPAEDRPFVVLSHAEGRTAWRAEGQVAKRGVVTPPTSASFASIHKHDTAKVSRTTMPDDSLGKRKAPAFPRREPPRKLQAAPQDTLSKSELLVKLQRMFSPEKPSWTITELQRATQQPLKPLKDALRDLCYFNTSSKAYCLKAEYDI